MNHSTFDLSIATALFESSDQYPVDFDDAWQWLEYSRKDAAKRSFLGAGFFEGIDFVVFHDSVEDASKFGGTRKEEKIHLTCECFKQWGMLAGTEKGREVRLYFLECERIAKESRKPKTQIELLVESAQHLLEIERRQQRQEQELSAVKEDVRKIHERAEAAEQELKSLPAPNKTASPRTARTNINSLVRTFCHRNDISHSDAYKSLYREFRDRYHVDLKVRAANGKSAPLDIAESLDVLDDLYALASELFGGEK